MASKLNISVEDFLKIALQGATQVDAKYNGDQLIYRTMELKKAVEVYSPSENGPFLTAKRFKITKINIGPTSPTILNVVSNKGDMLAIDEVGIDKHDVLVKHCENLLDKGNALIRKATTALVNLAKN